MVSAELATAMASQAQLSWLPANNGGREDHAMRAMKIKVSVNHVSDAGDRESTFRGGQAESDTDQASQKKAERAELV